MEHVPGSSFEVQHLVEAMQDPRVQRALRMAMRDRAIARRVEEVRRDEGVGIGEAIVRVAEEVCLSEEHVRSIVYRKLVVLKSEG